MSPEILLLSNRLLLSSKGKHHFLLGNCELDIVLSIPGRDGLQAFKQHRDCIYSAWIWADGMLVKEERNIPSRDFREHNHFFSWKIRVLCLFFLIKNLVWKLHFQKYRLWQENIRILRTGSSREYMSEHLKRVSTDLFLVTAAWSLMIILKNLLPLLPQQQAWNVLSKEVSVC